MLCLLLEGVTDRCLCSPNSMNLIAGSPLQDDGATASTIRFTRIGRCQPQSTASQQLPAPPHCFLYETAEGSACGRTRAERLGPKTQKSRCKTKGRPPGCVTKHHESQPVPGFRLFSDAYFSGCECARQNRACTYILYCQGAHMPGTILTYSEERRRKRRRSTYSACAASERRKHRKFCGAFGATHGNDFRKCFYHKNAARRQF